MSTAKPVVVVSNDTLIGPRIVEDLRPYCPAAYYIVKIAVPS